jgi:hypothetical protein
VIGTKPPNWPVGARGAGPAERRSSYRLALDPGVVALDLPGSPSVPVLDVSGDGASLSLPQAALGRSRLPTVLHLNGRHSFGADLELVRHASLDPDRIEVGVRFRGLSHEAWHDLGQFLIAEFLRRQRSLERLSLAPGPVLRIRDAARMTGILRLHGVAQGRPLSVYRGHQPLPVRLRLDSIAPNNAHLEATSDLEDALEPDVSYSFLLPASGAAILFSATARPGRGRAVRLSFPVEMLQGGFRDSLRLPTLHEEGVLVSFPHHRTDGLRRARQVQDVSDQGLSFPLAAGQDLLLPGDRLDDLRVQLPTGAVSTRAVIRSVAPRDRGGLTCGIELLDFEGAADRRRWERYLFSKAYPRTLDDGPDLAGMAWRMLDSSGYLDLWTRAEDRERLEHRFHQQWSRPAAVPGHLIVLHEESRDAGTFATSRLYPRTWLLHSLGVDKDARRRHGAVLDLARELYAAMLRLLKGETRGRFFALFVQKDKRWTDLLYGGFVRTLPPGAASVYDEYALYKCRTQDEPAPLPAEAARWSVREADRDELTEVARRLRGLLTPLEVEAYCYGEDEIDLGSFSAEDPAGFRRSVFVARDEDGPAAALVLESGSEGVNVFGLLNSCRIFFLRPVPDRAEVKGICGTLLAAARQAYRARDVREFIIFSTHEGMAEAAFERGSCLISDGVRWVASCELLQAWTIYIDEVLQSRSHELRGPRESPGRTATAGAGPDGS